MPSRHESFASMETSELVPRDAYEEWKADEGVPTLDGFYIDDLETLELHPWERKGGSGLFVNLDGTGNVNDAHIVEITAGGSSEPERHMYEEMTYVISGYGSTSVWLDDGQRQTFEWSAGSVFAIPLNAWYQHHNGSGVESARYMSVTSAPTVFRLFHSQDFVFNTPYTFRDRFSGNEGYFDGDGELTRLREGKGYRHVWLSNFIADARNIELLPRPSRGAGGRNLALEFADGSMGAHISEFPVGTYKKAHRHGPGAHVVILGGEGFSLLWQNMGDEKIRCDWNPGSVVVPPEGWFHQHFNTGPRPARYLALRMTGKRYRSSFSAFGQGDGSGVSVKEGGWQIEYQDEEREIHEAFERELKEHGAACQMQHLVPWCSQ